MKRTTHLVLPALLAAHGLFMTSCTQNSDMGQAGETPTAEQAAKTVGQLDAAAIGRAAGAEPSVTPDGVVRLSWPRKDVPVTVDGVHLAPAAGLASWAGFTAAPGGAMLMGDNVVFEDEVSPAMDAAFAHNLEVTAIHNHFAFDQPRVYYMHIAGMGDPVRLAQGVKAVWDAIREVRRANPEPATGTPGHVPSGGSIDAAAIEGIVGQKVTVQDGVPKVTIGREWTMHGIRIGGSMGLTTWAAFSGSNAYAAIDGDFMMTAEEVQPVLRAMRLADFHVVALHNHMIGEQPTAYFMHFWAKGPAAALAQGFRAALDAQAAAPH